MVVEGEGEGAILDELRQRYLPHAVVLRKDAASGNRLSQLVPFTAEQRSTAGEATVYVCRNFACEAPVSTMEGLRRVLG